jgi:hypothetical protein
MKNKIFALRNLQQLNKGPITQAKISAYLRSSWLLCQKQIYNLYLKKGPARADLSA